MNFQINNTRITVGVLKHLEEMPGPARVTLARCLAQLSDSAPGQDREMEGNYLYFCLCESFQAFTCSTKLGHESLLWIDASHGVKLEFLRRAWGCRDQL